MKIQQLFEGTAPKLPGAVSGIQVMTPHQFVAKSAAGEEPRPDDVAEASDSKSAGQAIQKLQSFAKMNPDFTLSDLERLPSHGMPIKQVLTNAIQACDALKQQYLSSKQPGNAQFIDKLKSEIKWFLTDRIQSQEPPTMGELLQGTLGKINFQQNVAEADGDLLGAQTRPFGGQEFQDYMGRIAGREKAKTDKYKLPYIHRSSVIKYYNEQGQRYDEGQIIEALKQRPKKLLKQNEKMKHSNGELEQFFNIGFAALVGIAVNESTDSLVIVNTCPGAGSCKVDCFAMKGGKVQFEGPWLSDGRILTYLLNDPQGFFNQLSAEISKEEKAGVKGGYRVTIRWHDAGDFFSPEYVDMAFKLAKAHPNVQFYAYTKMGDVAVGEKPDNFIINWSEGAHTSQEKKVKAADPNLERTKNSRIVPTNLFYDLLVKDEKKNLVKGPEGQWQVMPDKLPELKQRLAKQYGISANSILSYDEWDQKTQGGQKETPVKYNVIITPGEPDITAKSHGVLSTLLLKH